MLLQRGKWVCAYTRWVLSGFWNNSFVFFLWLESARFFWASHVSRSQFKKNACCLVSVQPSFIPFCRNDLLSICKGFLCIIKFLAMKYTSEMLVSLDLSIHSHTSNLYTKVVHMNFNSIIFYIWQIRLTKILQLWCLLRIICICRDTGMHEVLSSDPIHLRVCCQITWGCNHMLRC